MDLLYIHEIFLCWVGYGMGMEHCVVTQTAGVSQQVQIYFLIW